MVAALSGGALSLVLSLMPPVCVHRMAVWSPLAMCRGDVLWVSSGSCLVSPPAALLSVRGSVPGSVPCWLVSRTTGSFPVLIVAVFHKFCVNQPIVPDMLEPEVWP